MTSPARDDALTLDGLRECIRSLPSSPPKMTFASCRMFPGAGIGFRGEDGEEFVVAHPDYWTAVKDRVSDTAPSVAVSGGVLRGASLPLWGITVADLDRDSAERHRVMEQLSKVMARAANSEQPGTKPLLGGEVNPPSQVES